MGAFDDDLERHRSQCFPSARRSVAVRRRPNEIACRALLIAATHASVDTEAYEMVGFTCPEACARESKTLRRLRSLTCIIQDDRKPDSVSIVLHLNSQSTEANSSSLFYLPSQEAMLLKKRALVAGCGTRSAKHFRRS